MYITSKLLFLLSFQLWLMQKDPTWYVRDSTAQYMQHIYSVLSLSKCPSTKISIKYSKHSQVNKKKYIVKVPFHLHYWRVLCVSAQEGMCWCWDSSQTPPAGTHHIQSHLASTWDLAFVWTFSLRVYFTWSLCHAWVVTRMDCPLSAYRSRNWGTPILPSAPAGCISDGFRCRSLLIQAAYRRWGIKLFLSVSPEWQFFSFF